MEIQILAKVCIKLKRYAVIRSYVQVNGYSHEQSVQ